MGIRIGIGIWIWYNQMWKTEIKLWGGGSQSWQTEVSRFRPFIYFVLGDWWDCGVGCFWSEKVKVVGLVGCWKLNQFHRSTWRYRYLCPRKSSYRIERRLVGFTCTCTLDSFPRHIRNDSYDWCRPLRDRVKIIWFLSCTVLVEGRRWKHEKTTNQWTEKTASNNQQERQSNGHGNRQASTREKANAETETVTETESRLIELIH